MKRIYPVIIAASMIYAVLASGTVTVGTIVKGDANRIQGKYVQMPVSSSQGKAIVYSNHSGGRWVLAQSFLNLSGYARLRNHATFTNVSVNSIQFNLLPTVPTSVGSLYWDDAPKTLAIVLPGGVTAQINQETLLYARNDSGVDIANGQPVYQCGGTGRFPDICLSSASSEAISHVIGVATQDIPYHGFGFITRFGTVNDIRTDGVNYGESWVDGERIFLNLSSGKLTKNRPLAPHYGNYVGQVLDAKANNGAMNINARIGYELDELHDVKMTTPISYQDFLVYNSVAGYWENKSAAALSLAKLRQQATFLGMSTASITSSGSIGIGTAPLSPLHVVATTASEGIRVQRSGVTTQYLSIHESSGSAHTIQGAGTKPLAIINSDTTAGAIGIDFAVNGATVFGTGTRAMSIMNSGRVGIGTILPGSELAVNGTITTPTIQGSTVNGGTLTVRGTSGTGGIIALADNATFKLLSSVGGNNALDPAQVAAFPLLASHIGGFATVGHKQFNGYAIQSSARTKAAVLKSYTSVNWFERLSISGSGTFTFKNQTTATNKTVFQIDNYGRTQLNSTVTSTGTITDRTALNIAARSTSAGLTDSYPKALNAGLTVFGTYSGSSEPIALQGDINVSTKIPNVTGLYGRSVLTTGANIRTIAVGMRGAFAPTGAGTITSKAATAIDAQIVKSGGHTLNVTDLSYFSGTDSMLGGGTYNITNLYGLKLPAITRGITSNYSIYSPSGTMYHGGKVGIGTTTPRSTFDNESSAVGKARVIVGSATNYGVFDQSLGLRYAGNTTTWDDLRVEFTSRSTAGAGGKPPAFAATGFDALLFNFYFENTASPDEELFANIQMSHAWKEQSRTYPHIHGYVESTNTGTACMVLRCSWATPFAGTYTTGTVQKHCYSIATNSQYKHIIFANSTGMDMSGKYLSSVASCRVTRDESDTFPDKLGVTYFDIHHEIDSTGSDTEYSKSPTP